MRRVSAKHKSRLEIYYELRNKFIAEHPWCQMCIWEGKAAGRGARRSVDLHHRRGRGKYLNDRSTFCALCREHHDFIHSHGKWARRNGWLISKFA